MGPTRCGASTLLDIGTFTIEIANGLQPRSSSTPGGDHRFEEDVESDGGLFRSLLVKSALPPARAHERDDQHLSLYLRTPTPSVLVIATRFERPVPPLARTAFTFGASDVPQNPSGAGMRTSAWSA
jgi:hypothetical protein